MKTTRSIVPVLVVLTVLVAAALAIGMMGRGGQGPQNTELVDNGPNAGLSNKELVNKAVTNMRQLASYHMEVSGPMVLEGNPGQQMRLLADFQLPGPGNLSASYGTPIPGSRFTFSTEAHLYHGTPWPAQEWEIIWASDDRWYGSTDSGNTWFGDRELGMGPGQYLELLYSEECWGAPDTGGTPVPASSDLTFTDGSPRLEKVDGVVTRHMVTDVTGVLVYGPWADPPTKLDLWVSTDVTPTIRKLEARGNRGTPVAYNSLGSPSDAAFSPDGRTLAVAYNTQKLDSAYDNSSGRAPEYPGAVRLWDLTRPEAQPQILPADGSLASISYSGDGKYLAMGRTENGYASVWDLRSQQPVSTTLFLQENVSTVYRYGLGKVATRPDGKMVAAITVEGLFVWELPADPAKPPLLLVKEGQMTALAFSPDNHTLAVGMPEGGISLYDLSNPDAPPRRLAQIDDRNNSQAYDLVFSPDGNLLAGSNEKSIRIWDLRQAEPSAVVISGSGPWAKGIAFGPDSRVLVVGEKEGRLQVWNIGEDGHLSTAPSLLLEIDAQQTVTSLAVSSDGKNIAAATEAGPVLMWTLENLQTTGKPPLTPEARVMAGSEALEMVGGEPYTITWTWSHFNEDFGEIKPPPTETIK